MAGILGDHCGLEPAPRPCSLGRHKSRAVLARILRRAVQTHGGLTALYVTVGVLSVAVAGCFGWGSGGGGTDWGAQLGFLVGWLASGPVGCTNAALTVP